MKTAMMVGVLLAFGNAFAQAPIELRRADVLRTETGPDGAIRYLEGNVWIVQDTLSVTCDRARYQESIGRLDSEGNVHFVEPGRQIWADKATYYEKDGRATAEGNVKIEQDSTLIFCDRLIYNEAREEALFFGNVRLYSLPDRTVITGDHGAYNRTREYGMMTQNPRLVRRFDEADSLVIMGKVIEYFFAEKRALVTDSVRVLRGDFDARGGRLFYWDDGQHARLVTNPILKYKRDIMTADTVDAFFVEDKLRRVVLTNRAVAVSPVDSLTPQPVNRMTGNTIEIKLTDDQVDSILVKGNATSTYYLREEGEKKGANRVSGDVIDLWIKDGRIAWIYVEGGTEGVYFPSRLEDLAETEGGRGF
jgi:lipopolysaccharide export system protein LptA